MGGGGGIGGIISAVTNPIGAVANQVLGPNNDIAKGANLIGGALGPGGMIGNMAINQMTGQQRTPEELHKMGIDMSGRPVAPDFVGNRMPSGEIKDVYKTGNNLNTGAISALRENALRAPGTESKWAQVAKANAGNSIAKQQAGQLATATSNLAMQGGLRGGQRERLQAQSQQNGLLTKQNAYNQVAATDEQNRLSGLNNLAGQELQKANYDTGVQDTNINRATADVGQERMYDMNKYNEAMRAWAAQTAANAVPQTADKGFFGNLLGNFGF